MAHIQGAICPKHPELNGARYKQGKCVACQNELTADWYRRNKDKHKKLVAEHYRRVTKQKRAENPEHYREICKRFRDRNPERTREWSKRWRERNRERWLENGKQSWIKRYALMGAQKLASVYAEEIRAIYRNCPDGYEVDHIIPLRGKGVNGLHVPWNLQYLPAVENKKKGNRLEV